MQAQQTIIAAIDWYLLAIISVPRRIVGSEKTGAIINIQTSYGEKPPNVRIKNMRICCFMTDISESLGIRLSPL